MKLEKFDLEKALNGAKVVTTLWLPVTQLTLFKTIERECIYGVVNNKSINYWDINGIAQFNQNRPFDNLHIVPEHKIVYANVLKYANGDLWVGSECFPTFETAQNFCKNNNGKFKKAYVKTIEITDEL